MNCYTFSPDTSSVGSYYESTGGFRQQSTSPGLASRFPELSRQRQEAWRAFCEEDDQEFCPALANISGLPHPDTNAGKLPDYPLSPSHIPATYSAISPSFHPAHVGTNSGVSGTGSRRKALDIIDPATGLKVATGR